MTELGLVAVVRPTGPCSTTNGQPRRDPQSGHHNKHGAIDSDFRQRVGAVMENLWHRRRIKRELQNYERRLQTTGDGAEHGRQSNWDRADTPAQTAS